MMTTLFFLRSGVHAFRPDEPREAFLRRVAPGLPSPYVEWVARWTNALAACHRWGGEAEPLRLGRPLKERLIARHDRKAHMTLPAALRSFFQNAAGSVNFSWRCPGRTLDFYDGQQIVNPTGRLHLRLKDVTPVVQLNGWDPEALGEDADGMRAFLENAIAFMPAGDDDHLVIDMRDGQVKYLSRNDPDAMGAVLGPDFETFMDAWSRLGCVGPEMQQLRPFLGPEGLDPESVNGRSFREWLS